MGYYCGPSPGDTYLGNIRGSSLLLFRNNDWDYYTLDTDEVAKIITDYSLLLNIKKCYEHTCPLIPSIDEFLEKK